MRILLATGAMYPEPGGAPIVAPHAGLAASDAAAALLAGWRARRDDDVLVALPIPDGGPGTAQAIGADHVSARRALQAYSPLGEVREVDLLQLRGASGARAREGVGRTWLLDAARLTAVPADVDLAAREAREGTTDGLGEALAQALTLVGAGDTLVVGLARSAVHDGGRGLLDGLGGPTAAHALFEGREVLLALADGIALGGLAGAGQALTTLTALSPAEAQERDRLACTAASQAIGLIGAPRRGALAMAGSAGDSEDRLSISSWGTGAAGGGAAVLRALGARAVPGARVMAHLLGLDDAVNGQDLVATSAGEVYDVLADSVIAVVGTAAGALALPTVLVAGRSLVPRGELAEAGIVSSYALEDAGAGIAVDWNEGGPTAVEERLFTMGSRLARSWSR